MMEIDRAKGVNFVSQSALYGGSDGFTSSYYARTLFSQTMGFVALTAAVFAGGAYVGRNVAYGTDIFWYIGAIGCLIAMRFAVRRSQAVTIALLVAFGVLLGVALAPLIAFYAKTDPGALSESAAATALFIAGFGAAGYASRRDLSSIARICFFALIGLIVFGIVMFFVNIPHGSLIYSVLGLVIFAGFTMFDFQRLRAKPDLQSAPLLAASIFLDILNVFLFFLRIFGRSR